MRLIATALVALTLSGSAQQVLLHGIEPGDIDHSAQPCDDFYQFANGTWRATHPIPASMGRWSRHWEAAERNKDQLRIILDEFSATPGQPAGSSAQLTGDFYAACTDTSAVDAAGLHPLQPLLQQIQSIHDATSLQAAIAALQAVNLPVPFHISSTANVHDPQRSIAEIDAAGLGLPDRDYYLKPEPRFVQARAEYVTFIDRIMTLAGDSPAQAHAAAGTIMHLETAFARASLDNVALRDPHATDHVMSFADLQHLTPHFNWTAFYHATHIEPGTLNPGTLSIGTLNIDQPAFFTAFDHALATSSIADWKTYLRFHLLQGFAPDLSTPFVDANFNFYGHRLAGVGELKPRSTRCAERVDTLLGEALGQEYVRRYFPPEAKQRATVMITNLLAAMHDTIDGLEWMSPQTKQRALEKLAAIHVKVGYPDHWKDYSSVHVARATHFDNVLAASRFVVTDNLSQIGKPVDHSRWEFTPPASDASYNTVANEITFPAGILQPPAFSVNATDAVNYGAIGVVIGHEISHGFDDQGAQFDAQGRLNNWWTPADLSSFQAKTACVAHQFDGYVIDSPGNIHINGKLTLGESVADLAGLKMAWLAFGNTPQSHSTTAIDGFTPAQQFFLAWAQFRGDQTRPETQKAMTQGDPHPVAKFRVLGPDANFPPFAEAFSCKPGSAMVRPAAERCVVW